MNVRMTQKQKRRLAKVWGKHDGPLVASFIPTGRSGLYIYAVTVRDHPDKVKIGMTRNWKSRRHSYACWNLSNGDGVLEERVFCITEEFVDLPKLENHILCVMPLERAHGREWFFGTVDEASREIDRVMCDHGISYDL